jgi:hypothetical protein
MWPKLLRDIYIIILLNCPIIWSLVFHLLCKRFHELFFFVELSNSLGTLDSAMLHTSFAVGMIMGHILLLTFMKKSPQKCERAR